MNRREFLHSGLGWAALAGNDWNTVGEPGPSEWDVSGETESWASIGDEVDSTTKAIAVVRKRPVVRLFTATWCSKCYAEKNAVKAAGSLPFDLLPVDVTEGGQPQWVTKLPTFWWIDYAGKPWQSQEFQAVLNSLVPPPAKVIQVPTKNLAGYHTHTCRRDGYRWGHVTGSHNCPQCGRVEYRHDVVSVTTRLELLLSQIGK